MTNHIHLVIHKIGIISTVCQKTTTVIKYIVKQSANEFAQCHYNTHINLQFVAQKKMLKSRYGNYEYEITHGQLLKALVLSVFRMCYCCKLVCIVNWFLSQISTEAELASWTNFKNMMKFWSYLYFKLKNSTFNSLLIPILFQDT